MRHRVTIGVSSGFKLFAYGTLVVLGGLRVNPSLPRSTSTFELTYPFNLYKSMSNSFDPGETLNYSAYHSGPSFSMDESRDHLPVSLNLVRYEFL